MNEDERMTAAKKKLLTICAEEADPVTQVLKRQNEISKNRLSLKQTIDSAPEDATILLIVKSDSLFDISAISNPDSGTSNAELALMSSLAFDDFKDSEREDMMLIRSEIEGHCTCCPPSDEESAA